MSNKPEIPLTAENRQELRLTTQETVFIEAASGNSEDGNNSHILISHSVDISANGLQVILDEALTVGGIYQLCVQFDEPEERFHLTAEVVWALVQPEEQFLLGFRLFESDDTDIQAWKQRIAQSCRKPEDQASR